MDSWPRTRLLLRACEKAGLVFVGPPADAIATMGDKVAARASAVAAGVPILPGTTEPVADAEAARALGCTASGTRSC